MYIADEGNTSPAAAEKPESGKPVRRHLLTGYRVNEKKMTPAVGETCFLPSLPTFPFIW